MCQSRTYLPATDFTDNIQISLLILRVELTKEREHYFSLKNFILSQAKHKQFNADVKSMWCQKPTDIWSQAFTQHFKMRKNKIKNANVCMYIAEIWTEIVHDLFIAVIR